MNLSPWSRVFYFVPTLLGTALFSSLWASSASSFPSTPSSYSDFASKLESEWPLEKLDLGFDHIQDQELSSSFERALSYERMPLQNTNPDHPQKRNTDFLADLSLKDQGVDGPKILQVPSLNSNAHLKVVQGGASSEIWKQPSLVFKGPHIAAPGPVLGFYGTGKNRVSLAVSREQVYKTLAEQRLQNLSYELEEKSEFRRTEMSLQFMDERSSPGQGRVYPVSGVKIFVLGTNIIAETDPTGIVTLSDVPSDSDIQIRLEDPNGIYVPAHYEVSTSPGDNKVARLFAYRDFALGAWMSMTGIVPDANRGTVCGSFSFSKGAHLVLTLDGSKANGPYYFNDLGLIDMRQTKLGDNGKYCFFNAEPGPIAISLKEATTKDVYSIAVAHVYPGLFLNLQKVVSPGLSGNLKLGILPSGPEELYSNRRSSPLLRSGGEGANLVPMGLVEGLSAAEGGVLAVKGAVPSSESKLYFFNHSSDFDDTFYAVDQDDFLDDRISISLLPRGFSEDLARYAGQVQDSSRGTILVFDGGYKDLKSEKISHEIYDVNSRSLGKAWQYSADSLAKSMFFNIEPGQYTIVSRYGNQLIQMRSVMVFAAHTSVATLGARIRFVR